MPKTQSEVLHLHGFSRAGGDPDWFVMHQLTSATRGKYVVAQLLGVTRTFAVVDHNGDIRQKDGEVDLSNEGFTLLRP